MTNGQQIPGYEKDFFRAGFCRDRGALSSRFCSEFTEHAGSCRVYRKADIIDSLSGLAQDRGISISGFTLTPLGEAACLARYRSWDAAADTYTLRVSVWIWRDKRWQLLFHQGTPESRLPSNK